MLVRSSPSTSTRSAASMSRRVGVHDGPDRMQRQRPVDQRVLAIGEPEEETVVADQPLEGEVGLERGSRRADADGARPRQARPRPHAQATLDRGRLEACAHATHELAGGEAGQPDDRPPDPFGAVDRFVGVAAAVTQEVAVHFAVEAVAHAAQLAVALTGDGVAAAPAERAHGGRRLQVPLAGVMARQGSCRRRRPPGRPRPGCR